MNSETKKLRPRPLSPHLQVYSWLISSTTSILHRLSGVLLSLGLLVLVAWLVITAFYPEYYDCFTRCMNSFIGTIALLGWALAIYYHLFNGIRHLIWDSGKGFAVSTINKTGPLVIIAAIVATTLTAMVAL